MENKMLSLVVQSRTSLLKIVAENATDGIYVKDVRGRYLLINPAWADMLGRSVAEVIGRTDDELLTPDDAATVCKLDRLALTSGHPIPVEKKLTVKGVARAFCSVKGPYFDEDGRIAGVFGIARDVTKRVKAEESLRDSEKIFRRFFELGLIGMAITSPAKSFVDVNAKLCEMLGYERSELLEMTWEELTHPEDRAADVKQFNQILAGEIDAYVLEKRFTRKDGSVFDAAISVKCLRRSDGSVDSLLGLVQDITDRRRYEKKILDHQKHLLSLATELILTEERERRSIAAALHDHVGQSLAIAGIKLGELREKDETGHLSGLVDEIRGLIDGAIRQTRSLTFELSPPILYELGLEAAVASLVEHFAREHGFSISFSADRGPKPLDQNVSILLFQSVRELIVNAIKHARASGIAVSSRREDNHILLTVKDDGVGFRPSADENSGVHGFGLFSIRERLRYLGGSMCIESSPGAGTSVTLSAPLTSGDEPKEKPE